MRLPFIELLEQEQRIALIAAVVRRMDDLELLAEDAVKEEPGRVALRIVGSTDMDSANRLAMATAVVSLTGKFIESAADVTSNKVVPAVMRFTKKVSEAGSHQALLSRGAKRLPSEDPELTAQAGLCTDRSFKPSNRPFVRRYVQISETKVTEQ